LSSSGEEEDKQQRSVERHREKAENDDQQVELAIKGDENMLNYFAWNLRYVVCYKEEDA